MVSILLMTSPWIIKIWACSNSIFNSFVSPIPQVDSPCSSGWKHRLQHYPCLLYTLLSNHNHWLVTAIFFVSYSTLTGKEVFDTLMIRI
jgi:hypothetical protein